MDENYLNDVRNNLYAKIKKSNLHKERNTRKIKFPIGSYASENVFDLSDGQNDTDSDSSSCEKYRYKQIKKQKEKNKKTAKKKMSPSTSEMQISKQISESKRQKRNENFIENYYFDLNNFFNESSFSESIIESHSGIEYEFFNSPIGNTSIKSGRIYDRNGFRKKVTSECDNLISSKKGSKKRKKSTIDESFNESNQNDHLPSIERNETSPLALPVENNEKEEADCNQPPTKTYCECFDLGEQKLVIVKDNGLVPFYGFCNLKVVYGKIDVLGYVMTNKSKETPVYSPRGTSLLVIKNITNINEETDLSEVQKILNDNLNEFNMENTYAALICSKIESFQISFIEKHISQQIFPKVDVYRAPQILFDPKDKLNITLVDPEWDEILKCINASSKVLLAGGKGVGKSTLLRYLINKLLNIYPEVRIIDLDPGQSEFCIPGCISTVIVTKPVLGPNYTHLERSNRSILSNVNIGHNPKKYIEQVEFLMNTAFVSSKYPILINYMGFANGIGINIISSVITHVKPTDIIQIDSKVKKNNFKFGLSLETIKENCCLFGGDAKNLDFNLINITSMTDQNSGWTLESRQIREMCVLAYFGKLMREGVHSLASHEVPLYKVGLNSIKIVDELGKELHPAVVNGNLVALSSTSNTSEIFEVIGYGLVRGIDVEVGYLVLITPEPIEVLENVNYLIRGSVSLPPSVYMTTDNIVGHIPYIMEGELEGLGQITKRSYLPANKK